MAMWRKNTKDLKYTKDTNIQMNKYISQRLRLKYYLLRKSLKISK